MPSAAETEHTSQGDLPRFGQEAVTVFFPDNVRKARKVQMHAGNDAMNAAIAASRQAPEMFDGVAELWWNSFEDIATNDSPEAQAAGLVLLEDERKFIDLPKSPLFFGEEKTIFG